MFNMAATEICTSGPEIKAELEKLAPIIDGTEHALDYGERSLEKTMKSTKQLLLEGLHSPLCSVRMLLPPK
jgi:hypothetical protein